MIRTQLERFRATINPQGGFGVQLAKMPGLASTGCFGGSSSVVVLGEGPAACGNRLAWPTRAGTMGGVLVRVL